MKKDCIKEVSGFDKGLLRERNLFRWLRKLRTNHLEYSGTSEQAVLDKLSTAKIIEQSGDKYTLEA